MNDANILLKTTVRCALGTLLVGVGVACTKAMPHAPTEVKPAEVAKPVAKTVAFAADVLPIFERKCVACHAGDKAKAPKGLCLTRELAAASLAPDGKRSARMYLNKKTNAQIPVLPETAADATTCGLAVKLSKGKHATYATDAEKATVTAWLALGAPLAAK